MSTPNSPAALHIIHLIPQDGVGGVEVAAREAGNWKDNGIRFELLFMLDAPPRSPWSWCAAAVRTWKTLHKRQPDVLLVSLWKAVWLGWLYRWMHPKVKLVVFLHASRPVHRMDALGHWLALRVCHEVWGDCASTLQARLGTSRSGRLPIRHISYLTGRLQPSSIAPDSTLRVVYWGRIAAQKNLAFALDIFARLLKLHPGARFDVMGPGEITTLQKLQALATQLGCAHAITWHGACNAAQIQRIAAGAHFYLQTSLFEGMAMSVVEAMQVGLVPVVTPVGEVATYARHLDNAIVIQSAEQAAHDMSIVFQDSGTRQRLSTQAVQEWQNKSTYPESIRDASFALAKLPRPLTSFLACPTDSVMSHKNHFDAS
jgi:glycosyltransferase involved in cell wall biosynthesis